MGSQLTTLKRLIAITIFSICATSSVIGQIKLPRLLSDGAVLQRDTDLKIWGWATPGEMVDISLKNQTYQAITDENGSWRITLPPQPAGGPFEMKFRGSNEITLKNILFGEVWLCSGQSNMELTMHRLRDKYPEFIKNSKNPKIRQFLVEDAYDFNKEHNDFESGSWKEANPDNLMEFSGVAYFFANEIYKKYKVPVGLINAALGGSPVESWMSEDALRRFPEAYNELQQFKDTMLIEETLSENKKRQEEWYSELDQKDKGLVRGEEWYSIQIKDRQWKEMQLPDFWNNSEIGDANGVVWFRKDITIPNQWIGKKASLWLGRMVDQDYVYVNGIYVGSTGYQYPPRKYLVKDSILTTGVNTIAIRLINQRAKGGFIKDKPYFIAVGSDTIDLKGNWKYQRGASMPPLSSPTFVRWKPGGLYNKMIAPLLNYAIKGVIWYQGESNTRNPKSYHETFPALIENWREKWGIGNFPFLYVQLANFKAETEVPVESSWAELRQVQLSTLSVPNTGMTVIIDLGEWNDIHPLNKRDVGKRLYQEALRLAYGETNTQHSPVPDNFIFRGDEVQIFFRQVTGLKTKNGKPLSSFELSEDGKTFLKAEAKIVGNSVIVSHNSLLSPVAVRYAWSDNPIKANLTSLKGLPASPFELRK